METNGDTGWELPRLPRIILFGIVMAVAFSYAFTPLRSSQDEWWHLKTGKWIVEKGHIPLNDIFTYTGENTRWYNHEWLSEVIFYKTYQWGDDRAIGGIRALITFKAILVSLTIALVMGIARLRGGAWAAAFLVGFAAAEISRRTIYPRPPIFSYPLFALTLALLSAWKLGRLRARWLWILPPMIALWANLHGMCILGVFTTGCFFAGEVIEWAAYRWRRRKSGPFPDTQIPNTQITPILFLGGLTLACALSAMLNPTGWHIFFLGSKFTNDPLLKQVIMEMLPPPFFLFPDPQHLFVPGLAAFWITSAALLLLLAWNRFRLPYAADYLVTGFFLYQAAFHWRLLPLFALAGSGALAWLIQQRLTALTLSKQKIAQWAMAAATVTLAVIFVFTSVEPGEPFIQRNADLARGQVMNYADYPEPLMRFIINAKLPDRMFSQSNYCGYFMWRLSPEVHKLFTDNRFDVFGSEFYREELAVTAACEPGDRISGIELREGWRQILNRYKVNFIVIERSDRILNEKLAASGEWQPIYYYIAQGQRAADNAGFNVWLRKDPQFKEVAERSLNYFRNEHPDWPMPDELEKITTNKKPQQ